MSFLFAGSLAGVCPIFWAFGEINNRLFSGMERSCNDVWSLVRLYISLWASVIKSSVLLVRSYFVVGLEPLFVECCLVPFFCGLRFLFTLVCFHFFSMKVWKKGKRKEKKVLFFIFFFILKFKFIFHIVINHWYVANSTLMVFIWFLLCGFMN